MTTQTLRGMAGAGPMHWRGDRTGATTGQDPLDEEPRLQGVQPGVRRPARARDAAHARRDAGVHRLHPDGRAAAESDPRRSTTWPRLDQSTGQNLFLNRNTDRGRDHLHLLPPPALRHRRPVDVRGRDAGVQDRPPAQPLPEGRQVRRRRRRRGRRPGARLRLPARRRGLDRAELRLLAGLPEPESRPTKRQLEQFLLAFDTGLKPAVGQQVSIDATTFNTTAFVNRINLLVARADAGSCDLVVKGNDRGRGARRGLRRRQQLPARPPRRRAADDHRGAQPGGDGRAGAHLHVCATRAPATRIGVDRDLDGVFDRRELDCGTDPAESRRASRRR